MTDPGERLYAVACAGMFVFGMMLGLPGTVLGQSETVAQFGLTLADRGLLIATLFAGLLVGSFLSGALVDSLGQVLCNFRYKSTKDYWRDRLLKVFRAGLVIRETRLKQI